jgi:RNA polymerase sigma-70 factor (sigma-E family)
LTNTPVASPTTDGSTNEIPQIGHGRDTATTWISISGLSHLEERMQRDREFDDFALAVRPRLRRTAYRLCGDHHLAEDLAQSALARTYARWRAVQLADAAAYTHRALINLNIDRMRRRRLLEVGDALVGQLPSPRPGPDQVAEDRDLVVRLLDQLTDRERQVVVLRHYFDLPEADVSHKLGISVGTVKSSLSKAIAKLRARQDLVPEPSS